MRKIIIGAIVAVAGAAVVSSSVLASTGGIGGRPANPDQNNPRTQSIFVYTLDKGQRKDDAIIISNATEETQTIELLAVDGEVTNSGAYSCRQNVEEKKDLGGWITLSKKEVTLDAGQKQEVPFTVVMPDNADTGEHNACIVYQRKDDEGEIQGGVRIRTRQALRVVATVPGDLRRDIAITSLDVGSIGREQSFTLNLQSEGNVSADVDMGVTLTDVFGNEIARSAGGYPVLAGQAYSQPFTTQAQPLFGGWYTVKGAISYDSEIGALGVNSGKNPVTKESDAQVIFLWPTLLGWAILIAIFVIVDVIVVVIVRLNLRRRAVATKWATYTVKQDETIESIAARAQVSWKYLAKANGIKAPYHLPAGRTIKVPKRTK